MLHPVGNLPAHVYWRRRLFFVALPVLGVVLIAWALLSSGGGHSSPSNTASTTTKSSQTPTATTPPVTLDSGSVSVSTTAPPSPATTPASTTPASTTPAATTPSVAALGKGFCPLTDLTITAGVAHPSFAVKAKPVLYMPVTNEGATACKVDVADKNEEWRVYSGDVRVWGSHDCAVKAGTNVITLMARQTIRLSITWSGLTSLPGCKGTRLAVQAGTYRLYAYLNGKQSAAITFTIT